MTRHDDWSKLRERRLTDQAAADSYETARLAHEMAGDGESRDRDGRGQARPNN